MIITIHFKIKLIFNILFLVKILFNYNHFFLSPTYVTAIKTISQNIF
jgi:hypothetical protein